MKIYTASLESSSPYGQTRYVDYKEHIPEGSKMTHDEQEKKFWREKLSATPEGNVYIPASAFKNCLSEAAKYLSIQIPGKGKATYTKHFEAGVMVVENLVLPAKKKDVPCEWHHVPSDGKRGGSKRVMKAFPCIQAWRGDVQFIIFEDELISPEIFKKVLSEAGKFIGIGCFRPRNNGYWGRFKVTDVKVAEYEA